MQAMAPPTWSHMEYSPEEWAMAQDYQSYFPVQQTMMGPMVSMGDAQPMTLLHVGEGRTRRLGREQWPFLEQQYSREPKPSTKTKQGFADMLGVDIAKINNWFQNRRAKTKQEEKKRRNQELMGIQLPEGDSETQDDNDTNQDETPEVEQHMPYRPSEPLQSTPSSSSLTLLSTIPTAVQPVISTSVPVTQPFYASYPHPAELSTNPKGYQNAAVQTPGITIDTAYAAAQEYSQHDSAISLTNPANGLDLGSSAYSSGSHYSQHEATTPVHAIGSAIEMVPNTFISAPPYSPRETTSFHQSLPSSTTQSPGEWSNYNTISSPPREFGSDATIPSDQALHAHDIFGSPSIGPWHISDYSVQNSPAVADFSESALSTPTAGGMMTLPSSFLSPPLSRDMNSSTVSLSALDTYHISLPEHDNALKPRQSSQPSLAERRRKAGPSSIRVGPGSNMRTASYTAGMMPATPRSPLFVEQTLRKVKSNGNGAGRIQKPGTPGISSPGIGSFANFRLDTNTPPPSAPAANQKFPLLSNMEYPAPVRSIPLSNAHFEALTWNSGPMSAPPTQHTFALSMEERHSPGSFSSTALSPLS